MPVADADGWHLVWQDKEAIWSQKIDRSCKPGARSLVNSSQLLLRPDNGLAAAVLTQGGGLLVAFMLDGLYLKLGELSVRLADSAHSVVLAEASGLVAAWSTHDGSVFASRCDAQLNCSAGFSISPAAAVPRLLQCKGLWALFEDGPALQYLGDGGWSPGPLVNFHGDHAITAALDCQGDQVVSLWLERGGADVRWNYTKAVGAVGANLTLAPTPLGTSLGLGEARIVASSGFMLLVTDTAKLQVQLLNYVSQRPVLYPVHDLALGAEKVEVALDCVGQCRGAILCWAAGGVLSSDPASFHCVYRGLGALMDTEGLGIGGQFVVLVIFSMLLLCLLKQCHCTSCPSLRRRWSARGLRREPRGGREQLQSQLAQIPLVPLQEGRCETPQSPCPICQNEVLVRVALGCGHTACRDCSTRLVELGQPCHICRAPIEQLQVVYI